MRAQYTFPGATDSWLQRLLTWTPGQTDMIKTVALVLMVTDHTGLLLAGNNEVMRLLGRGCFPLFGLAWGMNLARHAEIRQSQLNSLWGWALVAQVSFMLIGYPWYTGNILFAFAVTGQRPAVGQPAVLVLHPPGGWTAGHLDTPVNRQLRHGRSGHAHRQLAALSRTACTGTAGIRGAVGPHGVADEYA